MDGRETGQPCSHTRKGNPCGRDGWMDGWIDWIGWIDGWMHGWTRDMATLFAHSQGIDGWMDGWIGFRWMDGWMRNRATLFTHPQGQPLRAPRMMMHVWSYSTMRLRALVLVRFYSTMRLRPLGKVFVLVHIKIWIGILMYEKSSMMLTGFIRLRQRAQCKFRSPTFIGLPIVSVRLIMPTLKFNASIRFWHPSCWAENLSMIPFRPRLFVDLKRRLAHFAAIHPSSPPMMNWKAFFC